MAKTIIATEVSNSEGERKGGVGGRERKGKDESEDMNYLERQQGTKQHIFFGVSELFVCGKAVT